MCVPSVDSHQGPSQVMVDTTTHSASNACAGNQRPFLQIHLWQHQRHYRHAKGRLGQTHVSYHMTYFPKFSRMCTHNSTYKVNFLFNYFNTTSSFKTKLINRFKLLFEDQFSCSSEQGSVILIGLVLNLGGSRTRAGQRNAE